MGNGVCGHLELNLLRYWQLRRDGEIVRVAARQQRLIAVLAVHGPSLRIYLAGLLWPNCPEPRALESLRVSTHLVTRQVPGLLAKNGPMLALDPAVQVDLHRVRALLQDGSAGFGQAARALLDLRGAELLPGWYEDWVVFEEGRLRQSRLWALTTLSRSLLTAGDCEGAAEAAVAALDIEPLYESAVRALVIAEIRMGNSASGLLAYEKYAVTLWQEMGVVPSEELVKLIDEVQGPVHPQVHSGRKTPVDYSAVLVPQPLPHGLDHLLPVGGGEAAVASGAFAEGHPGTEGGLAVGLNPRADDKRPAAGGSGGPGGGAVVDHAVT